MSEPLIIEQQDVYNWFLETAEDMPVEVDSEEVYLAEDDEKDLADAVTDIKEIFEAGAFGMSYRHISVVAAIAFWDGAEILAFDYDGWGGERPEDD